jgi:hypothetical protein
MYGTLYTSSEYYDKYQYNPIIDYHRLKENTTNNECIICWIPSTENSPVKCMKEHLFFVSKCDCNTFFHDTCLNKWLKTNSTCPICCTNISVKDIDVPFCIKIKRYTNIFFNNTFQVLRVVSFFSGINIILLLFYIIFFDFDLDAHPYIHKEHL